MFLVVFLSLTRQIAPWLGHNRRLPYNYFLIHRSSVILPFDVVCTRSLATGNAPKRSHQLYWQDRPSLEDSGRFDSLFTSLDFATIICLQSKFISLSSYPQPRGPGLCIYVPQCQGGLVIPPGTRFPFRRLLRLAVLRWRPCNPPPHGKKKSQEIYSFAIRKV
jgi:hypothetical protein